MKVYTAFKLVAVFLALVGTMASAAPTKRGDTKASKADWELVRSVPNGNTTMHYVLIPQHKQRDVAYYQQVAKKICGSNNQVMVFFWTDRSHIPKSCWMLVADMRVMTAQYERHPSFKAPSLRLAAWLYPSKEAAKQANGFFMP